MLLYICLVFYGNTIFNNNKVNYIIHYLGRTLVPRLENAVYTETIKFPTIPVLLPQGYVPSRFFPEE